MESHATPLPNRSNDPLGLALAHLIKMNGAHSSVIKQIQIIQEEKGSLKSVDDEGLTFLSLALDTGVYPVAETLFELQQYDDDVLFHVDRNGRTVLHLAFTTKLAVLVVEMASTKKKQIVIAS
jgi:hypothetical protein